MVEVEAFEDGGLPPGVYDVVSQRGTTTFTFESGFIVTASDDLEPAGGCACGTSSEGDVVAVSGLLFGLLTLRRRRRR